METPVVNVELAKILGLTVIKIPGSYLSFSPLKANRYWWAQGKKTLESLI